MGQNVSGGKRPIGLAVVRDPAAPDVPVTLAVLQNGQMLRKIGHDPGTAWLPASNFTQPDRADTVAAGGGVRLEAGHDQDLRLRPGHRPVAVRRLRLHLDPASTPAPTRCINKQGFVAVDPVNENIVYVSTSAGLSVIPNAGTAGTDAGDPHADLAAGRPARADGRRRRRPHLRRHAARRRARRPDLGEPDHGLRRHRPRLAGPDRRPVAQRHQRHPGARRRRERRPLRRPRAAACSSSTTPGCPSYELRLRRRGRPRFRSRGSSVGTPR